MDFSQSSLLVDDELDRLRMGRHIGERAEERRMWESRSMTLRLPGAGALFGPSLGSALGLPALRSSRAAAGGRTPFALIHRTVSKREAGGSVARKDRVYFSLSPGQARGARLLAGAVERDDGRLAGGALRWQKSAKAWYAPRGSAAAARLARRYAVAPPPLHAPSPCARPLGTAAAHQRYIERAGAGEALDGAVYSRGTIGEDVEERAAFWAAVEGRERADGRVQCRIIAELPHEVSAAGRRRIADGFLDCFAARGLAAHAVINRPDSERDAGAGGDPRNVHLHLVYHDRPAIREARGRWRFADRKDRGARGAAWLRELRARYAACCNEVLEADGSARRYFPGTYAELGIDKLPQRHLGPVLSALERQGRATRLGALNLVCERDWERRELLGEAGQAAGAVSRALSAALAAAPAGPLSRRAGERLTARAQALAAAAAPIEPELVEAALAARDRNGRRERAARLVRHAARDGRRGRDRAAWAGIAAAAESFLRSYRPAAPLVDARAIRRRAAAAEAAGRGFEAALLLDRRALLVERIAAEAERAPGLGLLRELDMLDAAIAQSPNALRLARRLGLREEIARRGRTLARISRHGQGLRGVQASDLSGAGQEA